MYKAGDVVLVKMHPSSGAELKRFRPCVIPFNQFDPRFYSIIPLTSQTVTKNIKTEIAIKPSITNGLNKSSLLLCWYIETVGTSRIQKQFGKLDKNDYLKMKGSLKHIFA